MDNQEYERKLEQAVTALLAASLAVRSMFQGRSATDVCAATGALALERLRDSLPQEERARFERRIQIETKQVFKDWER